MQAPESLVTSGSAVRRTKKRIREVLLPFLYEPLVTEPEGRSLQPSVSGVSEQTRCVGPAPSPDWGGLFPAVPLWSSGPHEGWHMYVPQVFLAQLSFSSCPSSKVPDLFDSTVLWDPKECQMSIGWSSRKENHTPGMWYCVEKSTKVWDSEWPQFNPSTRPLCFVMLSNLKSLLKKSRYTRSIISITKSSGLCLSIYWNEHLK